MTDPRIVEIEAAIRKGADSFGVELVSELLSLVAEKDQRIEALEAMLGLLAIDDEMHLCLVCREDPYCDGHAQECLIGTLPALGAVL